MHVAYKDFMIHINTCLENKQNRKANVTFRIILMIAKRVIIWFRQDLRLHDNEALRQAISHGEEVIPVFVFDPRVFAGKTKFGFNKTDKYRAKFILESIQDLKESLATLKSKLIIRFGNPEDEIFKIAQEAKSQWVFCNRERTREELQVQDALEEKLWSIGQEVRYSRGKMLYYTQDLPFPITHTPDTFTLFRKEVEKYIHIREPLPAVEEDFEPITVDIAEGSMPSLRDFGLDDFEIDSRSAFKFKGGEKEGLKRLHYYLFESKKIKTYLDTRNGLLGEDYSSKLSPWLAQGCLSPKKIYSEIKKFEREYGANKSTYWLYFELLWRDFFRLMAKKHKEKIFLKGGIQDAPNLSLKNDFKLLNLWLSGRTGVPFIDANMRELALTGFMSNRGRQNVASFLINDLNVNWQMGAEYFESLLIDYDVCSNWGNWNYIAGVGSDPRENRYFNILSQATRYDPKGDYVKHWLPELNTIPYQKIHRPDTLSEIEQESHHVILGDDYPKAMVKTDKWI